MLLNYISIKELNFSKSWKQGCLKIKQLNAFDKYITIFWILGPLIFLIERDPADIWITIICLIFVFRCFIKKEWYWTSQFWFTSAIMLWFFGLISAITSPDPYFSFQQGFVWIRFPLYAAAAQVWLAKDRDIRIVMLLSMLIGLITMCFILVLETIVEPKLRLTWPYGDMIPGTYLVKFLLPLLLVLVAIMVSKKSKPGIISGLLALLTICVSVLTGERTNYLIRACSGILAGLVWKPKFILYSILIVVEIIAVFAMINMKPDLSDRFGKKFIDKIPIFNFDDSNEHWGAWRGGIQQGLLTPIKGIGPSGTRKTCAKLNTNEPKWLPGKNYCGNHPHNYYIQLFSEVGIIGLFLGCLTFASIILTCYKARKENFECPMSATAFVIPLAFFFPLQQFGSFYGQWNNLFAWFAIGFALAQYQGWRKPN